MAATDSSSFPFSPSPRPIFDIDRLERLIDQADVRSLRTTCAWESAESAYGACDAVPCGAKATVYDTQTEQE